MATIIPDPENIQNDQDEDVYMEDFTTDKGNTYHVSVSREEAQKRKEAEDSAGDAPDAKHSFDIEVNWPVTGDVWTPTTKEVSKTAAITRYKLIQHSTSSFTLHFTNTEHYDYQFVNLGGESFSNSTWINRNHYIDLAPDHKPPKFIRVKGD